MSPKFEMPADFGERLKKAATEIGNEGVERMGAEIQAICDATFEGRQGKSADGLYAELKANLKARDFNLPEKHLRTYAGAIAEGRRVTIETESAP